MTKKHFNALAAALRASRAPEFLPDTPWRAEDNSIADAQWRADVRAMADVCASFNPAFDRDRFIAACYGG